MKDSRRNNHGDLLKFGLRKGFFILFSALTWNALATVAVYGQLSWSTTCGASLPGGAASPTGTPSTPNTSVYELIKNTPTTGCHNEQLPACCPCMIAAMQNGANKVRAGLSGCSSCGGSGDESNANLPMPIGSYFNNGNGPGVLLEATSSGSIIESYGMSYLHWAYDIRAVADGGTAIQRIYRPRNMADPSSFGPGFFSSFDHHLSISPTASHQVANFRIFDPLVMMPSEFALQDDYGQPVGGPNWDNGIVAKVSTYFGTPYQGHVQSRQLRFLDSTGQPSQSFTLGDGPGNSEPFYLARPENRYAKLKNWDDSYLLFELISFDDGSSSGYGYNGGRLVKMVDSTGKSIDITYKTFTEAEIRQSPERLWQRDTIDDGSGRIITYSYATQQVAGRWAVEEITSNDGQSATYAYASDKLDSVTYADNSVATFSHGFNSQANCWTIQFDDINADAGHRRKTLYASTLLNTFGLDGWWFPGAIGLSRMVVNGENEITYLNLPIDESASNFLSYVYEGGGRLKKLTSFHAGSESRKVSRMQAGWTIDQNGTQVSVSGSADFPDAHFASISNDLIGNAPATTTDASGGVRTHQYDADNWIVRTEHGDGTIETWCRNARKQPTRYRSRDGSVTLFVYDAAGNLTERHVGLVDSATNVYSPDPYTGIDTYNRCADDDVQTSEYAVYKWQYNSVGHRTAAIDPLGNQTDYEYDSQGRLNKIKYPADSSGAARAEKTFSYDTYGRTKTVTDQEGNVTEYFYDTQGRRVSTLYADGTSDRVEYGTTGNGTGLVSATIGRTGVVTTYEYDAADRLVAKRNATSQLDGSGNKVATPALESVETWQYINGTRDAYERTNNDSLTRYGYDYKGRQILSFRFPRQGEVLASKQTYVDNQLFSSEDPYGRKTYYAYDATDGRLIRTVTATVPEYTLADFDAVLNLTRDLSPNAKYVITDNIFDADGNLVRSHDGRNIETHYEYDSRGRQTATIAAATLSTETRTETDYDEAGNVSEVRSPRYFDATDTLGYQKAKETWTYTGRNLVKEHTEAPGTTEAATESFTYDLKGRRATKTDFDSKVWEFVYDDCCGKTTGQVNPLDHGSLTRTDAAGRAVHQASLKDFSTHTDLTNPTNADTLREVTTRYDGRGRPVARTTWLTARGTVDVSAPPIAGLDSVSATDGLTEQFLYDDNLADNSGLDSTTGVTPLIGSTAISLDAAITKLADTTANGGAGVTLDADAPGSAHVSINPEGEVRFSISDAAGRSVMSGSLDSSNALITWSCQQHDTTVSISGYGTVLESRSVNALGHVNKQRSDAAGRTIQSLDALDKITSYTYDASGNRLTVRDPNSVGQDCVYDALGRDTSCTDTSSVVTSSTYDDAGNKITSTDAKSETTTYAFDARGRQVKQTDRLSGETEFAYYPGGRLHTLTDAEDQVTSYTYDDAGNKLTETYPDHVPSSTIGQAGYGIISFTYDAVGRTKVRTDQQGDTCTYTYDLAGRLASRAYAGHASGPLASQTATDTFTYDDAGRMLTAISGRYSNTVTYTYDDAGRKATEALTTNGQTYTVSTDYDAAGQVSQLTYPDGTEVDRTYTDRGQLHTLAFDITTIDTRSYDDGGRMTGSVYNNGVSETRAYNTDNTLASISYSGAAIGTYSYGWDANKNKTSETITGTMSNYGFTVPTSGYDDEDRLVGWNRADSNLDQSWALSLVGDWDSFTENTTTQSRTHGNAHEILTADSQSVTHDAKGNQTGLPSNLTTSTSGLTLEWDFENKLHAADVDGTAGADILQKFDALGRRISRDDGTTTTVFVPSGQQTIADYTAGTAASSPTYRYVYASYIDEPVMRAGSTSTAKLYYHRNQQYSVTALTDTTGSIVERYAYDACGKLTVTDGSGTKLSGSAYGNRYTYTGREWDGELGLYHYRARMYSPESGRFVSRDPIGYEGSKWGLYVIFSSRPISKLDPLGLKEIAILPVTSEIQDEFRNRVDKDSYSRDPKKASEHPGPPYKPEGSHHSECVKSYFGPCSPTGKTFYRPTGETSRGSVHSVSYGSWGDGRLDPLSGLVGSNVGTSTWSRLVTTKYKVFEAWDIFIEIECVRRTHYLNCFGCGESRWARSVDMRLKYHTTARVLKPGVTESASTYQSGTGTSFCNEAGCWIYPPSSGHPTFVPNTSTTPPDTPMIPGGTGGRR